MDRSSLSDWYAQINLLDLDSSPHLGGQSISKSTSARQGEGVKINYFEHQKFNLYVIQINSFCKRNTWLFIYRTMIILPLTKWDWFKIQCGVIMQSGTYIKLFNCFRFTSKDFSPLTSLSLVLTMQRRCPESEKKKMQSYKTIKPQFTNMQFARDSLTRPYLLLQFLNIFLLQYGQSKFNLEKFSFNL